MTLDMPRLATVFGLGLVAIGIGTYFASGQSSYTALIPAAFGLVLSALGVLAKHTSSSKHSMHAAAMVALLGFVGSANGLPDMVRLALGETVELPLAATSKSLMAIAMAAFLGLCIRSFRQARKAMQ